MTQVTLGQLKSFLLFIITVVPNNTYVILNAVKDLRALARSNPTRSVVASPEATWQSFGIASLRSQ